MKKKQDTSWQNVGDWYDKLTGKRGSYYHTSVIFPKALRLLSLKKGDSLLDLGCGNAAFARAIPSYVPYTGVDTSSSLLAKAKTYGKQDFLQADVTKPLPIKKTFSVITFFLSLQNMEDLDAAITNASLLAKKNARLLLVLNHPCFRIPRQSGWIVDRQKKLQSRRLDRYLEKMRIPIMMHPSKKDSPVTYSFHRSLEDYAKALKAAGFFISSIEEWISHKKSTGPLAKMEDCARRNFPLFLAILAKKAS